MSNNNVCRLNWQDKSVWTTTDLNCVMSSGGCLWVILMSPVMLRCHKQGVHEILIIETEDHLWMKTDLHFRYSSFNQKKT